jgi:hypothetical protein
MPRKPSVGNVLPPPPPPKDKKPDYYAVLGVTKDHSGAHHMCSLGACGGTVLMILARGGREEIVGDRGEWTESGGVAGGVVGKTMVDVVDIMERLPSKP